MNNQEYALMRWRKDGERDFPKTFDVQSFYGRKYVWLGINGNEGWRLPRIENGELKGIRLMSNQPPEDDHYSSGSREHMEYETKFLSEKMKRKIMEAVNA